MSGVHLIHIWEKSNHFINLFLILGPLERVMGAWGRAGGPNCLILALGDEYLLGYVLIENKHSGTIFTPKNIFSCKNLKRTTPFLGLSGEPLYNWNWNIFDARI